MRSGKAGALDATTSQDIRRASHDRRPRVKARVRARNLPRIRPDFRGPALRRNIERRFHATIRTRCVDGLCALRDPVLRTTFFDTTIPGFTIDAAQPFSAVAAYATLSNGDRIVFDGSRIERVAADGSLIATLASAHSAYPSFVIVDPAETLAVCGESQQGSIFEVDLAGAGKTPVCTLDFNYDAVFEDAAHVLVSAAPCIGSCGNEIQRVDLASGATALVAVVPSYSGPLARASNGDIYYVLQADFGSPPGSYSILRWSAAQIASGLVLGVSDATLFAGGFDGGSSLRFDAVFHHLFVTESIFGASSRLIEIDPFGQRVGDVITSSQSLSNIEFSNGPGPGSFQAFQPANGVTMTYRATDYSFFPATAQIVTVRPRRPQASTSGSGLSGPGPVTFEVQDALPNASMLVLTSPVATYHPQESSYDFGTFLFETGMALDHVRRLTTVATDASGRGVFTFVNPGNLQGTRVLQALIRDASGKLIGSSTAAFN